MKRLGLWGLPIFTLLHLTVSAAASELPTQISPTLGIPETRDFRAFANNLSTSGWEELSALGGLALEMAKALELDDPEGFVASQAIMRYRIEQMPDDLQLEVLRIQLQSQCSCPKQPARSCGSEIPPPMAWVTSVPFPPVREIVTVPGGDAIQSCGEIQEGAVCAEFTNGTISEGTCCIEPQDLGSEDFEDCLQLVSLIRDIRE